MSGSLSKEYVAAGGRSSMSAQQRGRRSGEADQAQAGKKEAESFIIYELSLLQIVSSKYVWVMFAVIMGISRWQKVLRFTSTIEIIL